jgi:hypothetical protein
MRPLVAARMLDGDINFLSHLPVPMVPDGQGNQDQDDLVANFGGCNTFPMQVKSRRKISRDGFRILPLIAAATATKLSCNSLISLAGAPEGIRTPDLCLRRAALYPAELRARGV